MNSENVHALYLHDLGFLVSEYAREAKTDLLKARGTDYESFAQGYFMGFHRLITLMQQQAVAFNIPLADVGLSEVEDEFFFNEKL
jgi:hypothetical protein